MASIITPDDPHFPEQLKYIPQPVKKLYVKGSINNDVPLVAIVGSRKAGSYGKQACEFIVRDLVHAGVGIASGLALGIDGWAHKIALENNGYTIAVLGGGLDIVSPAKHTNLAKQIVAKGGALVSEYPPGTPHMGHQFLERNRIISGLSKAVVIVEAAKRSGTLNTARHALDQGREVFAVPGPITSQLSQGTNQLIKSGAHPITNAQDVIEIIGITNESEEDQRMPLFTDDAQTVLYQLIKDGVSQDGYELQQKSNLSPELFQQALTMLELEGHVRPLGNNQWSIR